MSVSEVSTVELPADNLPAVIPLPEPLAVIPLEEPARPGLIRRAWNGVCSVCEWLFGMVCLIFGLAILAAIPILGFISLGYLLEAGGRIARTGRLRDGFFGMRQAARAGSIVIGSYLMLLPLTLVSSIAFDARLIDATGKVARNWRLALTILTVVMVVHIVATVSRGGKLRHFLWPFNLLWLLRRLWRGGYFAEARDAVWDFAAGMRLPYFFSLGLRGFAGAFVWLAIPISLIAAGRALPLVGFLGAFLLAWVLLYVPFLQMRFAAENRFAALFERRAIRALYQQAPWAFAFALFITLLFAVPVYLLKIEIVPREAAWLPGLFFIVSIFPARILSGWAYARALRHPEPRHWFFRWTGRLWMLPVALMYVVIVFFTQYTSWSGIYSLYEQHAFLLPVPFVGM
uniref:DUF4013 domain-containing protein n=1 Tax=uncultured Acidobacteria bacterium A2 TaxID=1036852 RepID=F8TTG1_9BACT|nr:hypothetical protein [uncultured Acidobacteria bacterium A2]